MGVLSLDSRLPKLEELNTPEFINKVMVLPYFLCKPYLRASQPCSCDHEFDKELGISKTPDLEINPDPENLKQICEKCDRCGGGIFSYVSEDEAVEFEARMKQQKAELREGSTNLTGKDRKRLKRQKRREDRKQEKGREPYVKCGCGCPRSNKCVHELCKACCKKKCIEIEGDCKSHKFINKLNLVGKNTVNLNGDDGTLDDETPETLPNPKKRPKLGKEQFKNLVKLDD